MNKLRFYKSFFMLTVSLTSLINLSGCDDEELTEAEKTIKLLGGSWSISSVTVDGQDQTDLFTGFTISFTEKTFATINGGPTWAANGSFEFTDGNARQMQRVDGLIVDIDELSENSLKLSLQWDETLFEPGRTQSISGDHVFTFSR